VNEEMFEVGFCVKATLVNTYGDELETINCSSYQELRLKVLEWLDAMESGDSFNFEVVDN
jgi:hypothetical protein